MLKNLSADATLAEIVTNILKLIQTFGSNSHTPHGGDHCFKALSKYCKWLVSPVCFEIFKFLGMSANPKLAFDSTLYQLAVQFNNQQNAQHTFAVHYKHLRPALQLLTNFKLFSYHTHMRNIRELLLLD